MTSVFGVSEKPSLRKNSGANVSTSTSRGLNRLTFATIASTRRRPIPRLRNIDFTATDTISTVAASALPISGWIWYDAQPTISPSASAITNLSTDSTMLPSDRGTSMSLLSDTSANIFSASLSVAARILACSIGPYYTKTLTSVFL